MISNTAAFIEGLTAAVNDILTCYYEEASAQNGFPFAVVNGIFVTPLNDGDLVPFYIDVYADEKAANATETLELNCDALRNGLNNKTISTSNVYYAHIGFESQGTTPEAEFDLAHRKLSFSARIFYTGGSN